MLKVRRPDYMADASHPQQTTEPWGNPHPRQTYEKPSGQKRPTLNKSQVGRDRGQRPTLNKRNDWLAEGQKARDSRRPEKQARDRARDSRRPENRPETRPETKPEPENRHTTTTTQVPQPLPTLNNPPPKGRKERKCPSQLNKSSEQEA